MAKIVEISWHDSCAAGGGWEHIDNLSTMALSTCRSVGYLTAKDKQKIILAQSYAKNDTELMNVIAIPRGCVESIKELSL